MKQAIVDLLKAHGDGISFVELSEIDGFTGEMEFGYENLNSWMWFWCSQKAVDALIQLSKDEIIGFKNTSPLTYHADGKIPTHPVAKPDKSYKTKRWLPTALYKGRNFEKFHR